MYYDRCDRVTRCPRVVIGTPDSWNPAVLFSGNSRTMFCAWSPCGQFITAQTEKIVEIRNHLTFEILTVLQSPNDIPSLTGPLAYSPDRRSLACAFSNGIVIWDIQTGGVVKGLKCRGDPIESLVWSLDGDKIGITSEIFDGYCIETYEIASGAQLLLAESSRIPHLWAYKQSFRFVTDSLRESRPEISISEIGTTLTKIESVSPEFPMDDDPTVDAFSPSTSRVSILDDDTLHVVEIRESNVLLRDYGEFWSSQFSPDGNFFAAHEVDGLRIWKYASGTYTSWREFPLQRLLTSYKSLEFSPSSVSILYQREYTVHVWPLDDSITPPIHHRPCNYVAIPPSGHYAVAAHGSTITIIGVHLRAPLWSIDTGAVIETLLITENVLLAKFSGKFVAWLLTEEGVGNYHSIWTISSSYTHFRVKGQVGVISARDHMPHFIYHTGTGDVLDSVRKPQQSSHPFLPWISLSFLSGYQHPRRKRPQSNVPPEDDWLTSNAKMQEVGWVMDPQGRHRLWMPVEWREPWERENWHHSITTLFVKIQGQVITIKF